MFLGPDIYWRLHFSAGKSVLFSNMVGKDLDELCLEFGTLSPHERIDVLSGLLQMCLGPELRFLGSVVVDLCKKDYIYLREQENKANKPEELESLKQNPTDIKNLQRAMAMNLALLHTDNTHCASIVFDILENNMKQAFTITPSTEKESVDIILLVLAMAIRHPAFNFCQRTKLYNYYMCVKQQLDSLLCKVRIWVVHWQGKYHITRKDGGVCCHLQKAVSFRNHCMQSRIQCYCGFFNITNLFCVYAV